MAEQKLLSPPKEETKLTLKMFNNDPQLIIFFEEWLNNGMNATDAYLKFHPGVTKASAAELGSRALKKVDKEIILRAYGIDTDAYLKQLREGMSAEKKAVLRKYDKEGNIVQELDLSQPDHKTRLPYHDKAGIMLGFEDLRGDKIQVSGEKVLIVPSSLIDKYGISSESGHSSQR